MASPTFRARVEAWSLLVNEGTFRNWELYKATVLACQVVGEVTASNADEMIAQSKRWIKPEERRGD